MLEEVVCAVLNLNAINELIGYAPGESDNYEFIFYTLEVIKNC
jgi:hypothetical protein